MNCWETCWDCAGEPICCSLCYGEGGWYCVAHHANLCHCPGCDLETEERAELGEPAR